MRYRKPVINVRKPYVLGSKKKKSETKIEVTVNTTPEKKKPTRNLNKSSIFVWINTFNRPSELKTLLGNIYENKEDYRIKIFIVDDCSHMSYDGIVEEYDDRMNIRYVKLGKNHGKREYWKVCNFAMNRIAQDEDYDYYVKLDDDVRLVPRFFTRCINIWESITHPRKICLNFRLDSREGKKVWTGYNPRRVKYGKFDLYQSQWVDMDFFVTSKFFKTLKYNIPEIDPIRWRYNPNISSGVGRYISQKLHKSRYKLFLTTESLVEHDDHVSHMNPHERQRTPLCTKPMQHKGYGL